MKDKIIAAISRKLKEIYPDGTIYLDSVMQSTKDFYFVLSVMESGTENVGIDIQNVSFLIDIALIDNKPNRNLINELVSRCGTFLIRLQSMSKYYFQKPIYLMKQMVFNIFVLH